MSGKENGRRKAGFEELSRVDKQREFRDVLKEMKWAAVA